MTTTDTPCERWGEGGAGKPLPPPNAHTQPHTDFQPDGEGDDMGGATAAGRFVAADLTPALVKRVHRIESDCHPVGRLSAAQLFELAHGDDTRVVCAFRRSDRGRRRPVGYMVVKLLPVTARADGRPPGVAVRLVRLGVRPKYRRLGVATFLLSRLAGGVECYVRERHLAAQVWLRGRGFRCTRIARGRFRRPDEDGYYFVRPAGESVRSANETARPEGGNETPPNG